MISKTFFERFTAEELDELNDYIEKVKKEKESIFPKKISDSDIPIRSKTALSKIGMETWEELANTSFNETININKLNSKTLKEIDKELKKRDLKWK